MTETSKKAARADAGHAKKLTVRQVRSGICTPKDQKATLKGLGLHRMGQTVTRDDTPAMRGMLRKVRHLVELAKG